MDGQTFNGMTINNILEKVDLLNFMFDEDGNNEKQKGAGTSRASVAPVKAVMNASDPTSAYLGPRLWNNPISLEDLMDEDSDSGSGAAVAMADIFYDNTGEVSSPEPASPASDVVDVKPLIRPSIIVPNKRDTVKIEPNLQSGANEFLYVESKRARLDREKEERKRKLEVQLDFAPEDIALATVPGLEFDPKTRAFDMEELRPQPIIKKRKKNSVPEDLKDDKYWEKRNKNKEATRRSREARRLKENQIVLRAAYLEKENRVLKQELDTTNFEKSKLETEIDILKRKLQKFESQSMAF
jgi:hypothetical protein